MEGEIDVIRLCLFVFACFSNRWIEEEIFDWGKWENGDWKDWKDWERRFFIWFEEADKAQVIWFLILYLILFQSF